MWLIYSFFWNSKVNMKLMQSVLSKSPHFLQPWSKSLHHLHKVSLIRFQHVSFLWEQRLECGFFELGELLSSACDKGKSGKRKWQGIAQVHTISHSSVHLNLAGFLSLPLLTAQHNAFFIIYIAVNDLPLNHSLHICLFICFA